MNCCNNGHNNNRRDKSGNHRSHLGHLWMMLLCCGLPVVALAVISLLGASFPGIRAALYSVLPFLCPVMMIAMLPMMLRKDKIDGDGQCGGQAHQKDQNTGNLK